jgi:sigma-B regulation protein RsbU (phosphoserine phosphatase)
MALGMVPAEIFDSAIEELTVPFVPGDVLIFYTDGLTEAIDRTGQEYGKARLAEVACAAAPYGSQALVDRLIAEVGQFRGQQDSQLDDLTLVVVGHR